MAQGVAGVPDPTERSDTLVQARCAAIRSILDAGTSPKDVARAQLGLGPCEMTGGPYIAREWSNAATGVGDLANLKMTSRFVRDDRIMEAMVAVAGSPTFPTKIRIAALDVLVGYAKPWVALDPLSPDTLQRWFASTYHLGGREGSRALPASVAAAVAQLLETLAARDADPIVRARAKRLSYGFALIDAVDAARASLHPEAISLTYLCGNTFWIRNANDAVVRVVYQVEGSDVETPEMWLAKRPDGKPYSERVFHARATGTVLLFYEGKPIQSVPNGGVTCGT
jgi:hypothetical protein